MGYVLSPSHVSNPEQAATRCGGVRSISLYPLPPWTGESWPIWLPGTGRPRAVQGRPASHVCLNLGSSPALLTLVGLHPGHLSPGVKKLVPLGVEEFF